MHQNQKEGKKHDLKNHSNDHTLGSEINVGSGINVGVLFFKMDS